MEEAKSGELLGYFFFSIERFSELFTCNGRNLKCCQTQTVSYLEREREERESDVGPTWRNLRLHEKSSPLCKGEMK